MKEMKKLDIKSEIGKLKKFLICLFSEKKRNVAGNISVRQHKKGDIGSLILKIL